MLAIDIKERLARDPFEPFRIRASSGEAYSISSPFQVAMMKSKVFIAFPDSDKWAELSYLHISALESAASHSRSKRRR